MGCIELRPAEGLQARNSLRSSNFRLCVPLLAVCECIALVPVDLIALVPPSGLPHAAPGLPSCLPASDHLRDSKT